MDKILTSVIKYRKITLFIVSITLILGVFSYYVMPRNEMPDVTTPIAIITVTYPGAEPSDIERHVVEKVEDSIAEIEGYDFSSSYIFDSFALIQLRMDYSVDKDKTWQELRRRMTGLQKELPEEVREIEINTDIVETTGLILSITGKGYSYAELTSYAEDLSRQLSKVEGTTRFSITGEQDKQVLVEIDYKLLNQTSLSLGDLVNVLKGQNIEIPSGRVGEEDIKINVKTEGFFKDIEEIKNLPIGVSQETGAILRLIDISDVKYSVNEDNYRVLHNGNNSVLLSGYFKPNSNVVRIGNEVEHIIEKYIEDLPSGVTVDKVLDQPADVKKSVNDFAINLLQGVVFVIIVVFLGMGLRNAVIVSTAIPLSIFSTFIVMNLLGIELHLISIASLIIALGMLVDNAIVISDSIQLKIDQEIEKLEACLEGVKEVAIPVLTSTLTTIAAFSPFLLMESIAGEFMITLPKIIIIALSASYLTAILVTPTMAYIFFKSGGEDLDKSKKIKAYFSNLLNKAMENKKRAIGIVAMLLVATGILTMNLDLQFFPFADKNLVFIDIEAEKNIDVDTTKEVTDQIEDILRSHDEVIQYTTSIGGGLPKFYTTVFNFSQSASTAQILMKIDEDLGDSYKNYDDLTSSLQQEIDNVLLGGKAVVKRLELAEYVGAPIQIRVSGDNLVEIEEASEKIKQVLYEIEGTYNVDDDFPSRVYQYKVSPDTHRATFNGLSKYDIQNEINIALSGRVASTLHYMGEEFDILVKSNTKTVENLGNFSVKSSITENKTILKNVADISLEAVLPGMNKYDRDYAIMITSDLYPGFKTSSITKEMNAKLDAIDLGEVTVSYDGELEKIAQNFGDMGTQAAFAFVLVYLILLFQFKSFIQPLVILLTIPLSIIGSIVGLFILRQPLSFTALMGMVSLMGIVVNNAIVLIDYINRERGLGKSIDIACREASGKRFRPIILSTTTTFIGMIPLFLSKSSLFMPMAISLMFGLMIATLLTLVIIPVVYSLFEKDPLLGEDLSE
ncbi:MAG: efflux RND transporter permease subunit [Clostridia bacterium]